MRNVRWEIPQSKPTDTKIKITAKQRTVRLSRLRTEEGNLVYPGLRRTEYANKYMTIAKAVKSGDFIVIPDFDEHGKPNFDGLCNLCGNRDKNACNKTC